VKVNGLFRLRGSDVSGYYNTAGGRAFNLNPLLLLVVMYIFAVHHKIVLARKVFAKALGRICGLFAAESDLLVIVLDKSWPS